MATFDVAEVTGKRKRVASPSEKTKRARLDEDGTVDTGIRRKQEMLRNMGVEHEFYVLVGKRLEDMTDAEKQRLKSIKLDIWLMNGFWELRRDVAKFWLASQDPIHITDPANHVVPAWFTQDIRWYKMWWENSPFTFPGDLYGARLTQALPHAERWIQNVFQPGRIGRPSHVIFEVLVECRLFPRRGSPQVLRDNLEALFWVFSVLGGDLQRLDIKVRFFQFGQTRDSPGQKRDVPAAAKDFENSVVEQIDRKLVMMKKHLDGDPEFGYTRFMGTHVANNPAIPVARKEQFVMMRLARELHPRIENLWRGWEFETGYVKLHMMEAFGLGNEARMVREIRHYLNPFEEMNEDDWPSFM